MGTLCKVMFIAIGLLLFGCLIQANGFAVPPGGIRFGDCAVLIREPVDWFTANNRCQSIGGFLARPKSTIDNEFLKRKLRAHKSGLGWGVWFGLHKFDNHWRYPDGTKAWFTNWAPGEPNDEFNSEKCVEMCQRFNWKWNDVPCRVKRSYICQKRRCKIGK